MTPSQPIPHSRAELACRIQLKTATAQKILRRESERALRALYAIEVVFRATLDAARADAIEGASRSLMENAVSELEADRVRIEALVLASGIEFAPEYSHPLEVPFRIQTPSGFALIRMIESLDALLIQADALWLSGILSARERSDHAYRWQRRLLRVLRRIVALEVTTRRGMEPPETATLDAPLTMPETVTPDTAAALQAV